MQKLVFYWTLLITICLPIALNGQNTHAQKFYEKGLKFYDKEDYEIALDYFVRSIEESDSISSNEETFNYLGKSYYALQKQYSGLLEEEVVEVDVPKVETIEEIKNLEENTEQNIPESPDVANTEEIPPENPGIKLANTEKLSLIPDVGDNSQKSKLVATASAYQGGVAAYRQSDYVTAIQYFTIVVEAKGEKRQKALNYRGMCYHALKDYTAAITDYDSTIELDEESYIAYHNRGISKQSSKLYNEALVDYNKTIQLNPDYSRAYESRALLYYKMGDSEKALNDCNKILELNADNTNAKKLKEKLQEENK